MGAMKEHEGTALEAASRIPAETARAGRREAEVRRTLASRQPERRIADEKDECAARGQ